MPATEEFRKAGFLDDDGSSGGKVAAAPVAEPTGVQPDVLVFRDGELAFRAPDVIAVKPVVGAQVVRGAEPPAVAQELSAGPVILNVGRELEWLAGFFRSGDEAEELARFAPEIFLA